MKKTPSKQDIRRQLQTQVDEFLSEGGAIKKIPQGLSGQDKFNGAQRPIHQLFDQPKQLRTPINDVVAALDERKKKPAKKSSPSKQPQRRLKTIYDDFGEPLRHIWVEE